MIGVIERPDGGVSLVIPGEDDLDTALAKANASIGGVVRGKISESEIPSETVKQYEYDGDVKVKVSPARAMRNAWTWNGSTIVPDEAKKKDIQWAHVREIRNKILEDSDKEMMKALETGVPENLKVFRQKLRDVPQDNADPFNIAWPRKL